MLILHALYTEKHKEESNRGDVVILILHDIQKDTRKKVIEGMWYYLYSLMFRETQGRKEYRGCGNVNTP